MATKNSVKNFALFGCLIVPPLKAARRLVNFGLYGVSEEEILIMEGK